MTPTTAPGIVACDIADKWSDQRFGPILATSEHQAVDGAWTVVVFRLARPTTGHERWFDLELTGAGCSVNPEEARVRASGEAIERYCAIDHDYRDQIRWMRPGHPDSSLAKFPACATDEPCPAGFTQARRPDAPIAHQMVQGLGAPSAWVPASHVHLAYRTEPWEPPITSPISTGLAYHVDEHTASWRGLCEVAERDALMLAWLTRRELPRIFINGDEVAERLDHLARAGVQVALFDMTTDVGVVAVLAVARSDRYPYLVVGAGAGTDGLAACAKAVDEVVSVRWTLGRRSTVASKKSDDFYSVRTLADHAMLYAASPPSGSLSFLPMDAPPSTDSAEVSARSRWSEPTDWAQLEAIGAELASEGMPVYWTRLNEPTHPFAGHTMKVIIPAMVPLTQSHGARFLDTPRLAAALSGRTPNRFPHPFA